MSIDVQSGMRVRAEQGNSRLRSPLPPSRASICRSVLFVEPPLPPLARREIPYTLTALTARDRLMGWVAEPPVRTSPGELAACSYLLDLPLKCVHLRRAQP